MPTSQPAFFFGHGSPLQAIEETPASQLWSACGAELVDPRAILCVSAHWFVHLTAVTAMAHPRTIHDFYGFPAALYDVQYPAPGDPGLAEEVVEHLAPAYCGLDVDSWGLDHGAWSVLRHLRPAADVPVLQLSVHASIPLAEHLALGRRLAGLRERGIALVMSGNVVHNLARLDPAATAAGSDWAQRFDAAARQAMTTDPQAIATLDAHLDFALASPTLDHLAPLAYLAGLAAEEGRTCEVLLERLEWGSLSMTSYRLSAEGDPRPR